MAVLRICILLTVCYIEIPRIVGANVVEVKENTPEGGSTHWFKTREIWGANNYSNTEETNFNEPLRLVVVHDTDSQGCFRFFTCAAEMRYLQSYYHSNFKYDIPYNFLIGNDGNVYEGRGWKVAGAHTTGYGRCSLGLAFVGDYSGSAFGTARLTELQVQRAKLLLEEGVKLGYLSPNFHVLGAKDLQRIPTPGTELYREIKGWSNYDNKNLYKNRTCDEIQQL